MATLQQFWHWLTEPSPYITEPDERRQASLLSSFLLITIVISIIVEIITTKLIDWEGYTGYRQTIMGVVMFVVIYGISRTEHIRLAAFLSVIVASTMNYVSGLAAPAGVLGGLLDFLILPLWLASLYLSMRSLIILIVIQLLALLAFPWLNPMVSLNQILVGPFSFIFATSILLIVFTRHRNGLERDRQAELTEKEKQSRRESARSEALLRVAARLNAQLDLEVLLNAICEEVAAALETPIAMVGLYDRQKDLLSITAGVGLPPDLLKNITPIELGEFGAQLKEFGTFPGLPDPQQFPQFPHYDLFEHLDLRALAYSVMDYKDKNIGGIIAMVPGVSRTFTEDQLLLLRGLAHQAAIAIINTRLYKAARHEAARAKALLRVAERLNTQLDLDTLLKTICEEATLALDAPITMVSLYDPKQRAFLPTAAAGIPPELRNSAAPLPRALYDEATRLFGTVFTLPDLQNFPQLPNSKQFQQMDLHALAFATMEYEGEIIGNLMTVTQSRERQFTSDELSLLQGLAQQAALAIVNTRLFKDAHRRLEHLQALRVIDLAISANHELDDTLDVLLKQITTQLSVDAAVILLTDQDRQHLEYGGSLGFHTPTLRFTRLRFGDGIAGRAAQQNKIIYIADLQTDPQTLVYAPSLAREGFVSYFAAPLLAQGKVQGVLEIFHRSLLNPDEEWLGFLEALAGQAAIAIENTTLFEDLQRTNDELAKAYDSTIEGWSHALDLRDKETEGHTRRVTELTLELARAFGFNDAELVHIRRGGLLHDIGKMGVPDRILLKEGKLTEEEWEVMRRHPGFAQEMLLPIHYLRPALDIPYCHHEKWDGSGYPRGLKGEEIPLTARIFAVVDVWDALTSDRPYRAAWSPEKTLAHIKAGAGSHFDPKVVEAFVKLIEYQADKQPD